jgi:hypothetical protein
MKITVELTKEEVKALLQFRHLAHAAVSSVGRVPTRAGAGRNHIGRTFPRRGARQRSS